MILAFEENGWEDYLWFQQNDKKLAKKINFIIKETLREPFSGIAKPEPLKGDLAGCWSRHISSEHRLVYKLVDDYLIIASCRFHYKKQ